MKMKQAYAMAELGANSRVLSSYFVVDKQLSLAINKEASKFRRGSGWIMTHVVHRLHANIIYRMYCSAIPENANLKRDISAEELLALSRTYLILHKNLYVDINRIHYIFCYLRTGVFSRKICTTCGMDYIFHSDRDYNHCPFCESDSSLFKK